MPQKSIASRSPNSSLLASRFPRRFRVTMAPESEQTEEDDSEELELEEAQAEAEALLAAESGSGEVSAELRAPAGTAGYTQRTRRSGPSFDRQRGQRGGNGGGGARRFRRRENTVVPQISDLLKEGQEVLIQIAKEPIGKKGARITSHIALPGRFLVYMPTVNHPGVSRKISSDEERQQLKESSSANARTGGASSCARLRLARRRRASRRYPFPEEPVGRDQNPLGKQQGACIDLSRLECG